MTSTRASSDGLQAVLLRLSATHPELRASIPTLNAAQFSPHVFTVCDPAGRLRRTLTTYIVSLNLQPGRRLSDRSIESYVKVAIDLESWLIEQKIELAEVKFVDIGSYRNHLINERKLANTSINLYMVAVVRYIRWLADDGDLPNYAPILTWANNAAKLSELKVRDTPPISNVPNLSEFKEILGLVPMPYRLMLIWYQATGLRRSELPRLNVDNIPGKFEPALFRLKIHRKGGYSQTVYVPRELITVTNNYIKFERQIITTKRGGKASLEAALFVNMLGRRASGTSAYRALKNSSKSLSLEFTLHSLRHLFAVEIYYRLKKMTETNSDINALKMVQSLLGHRSLETTMIYLKSLPIPDVEIGDALSSLLSDTI